MGWRAVDRAGLLDGDWVSVHGGVGGGQIYRLHVCWRLWIVVKAITATMFLYPINSKRWSFISPGDRRTWSPGYREWVLVVGVRRSLKFASARRAWSPARRGGKDERQSRFLHFSRPFVKNRFYRFHP